MASIDPDEEVTNGPPRATLRILHNALDFLDDDESEDDLDSDEIESLRKRLGITVDDDDEDDDTDESSDESDGKGVKGGPSDPEKQRMAHQKLTEKAKELLTQEMDTANGIKSGHDKGKGLASDEEDDKSDMAEDDEYVVCTLHRDTVCYPHLLIFCPTDPSIKIYQVPLDITVGENEECYFRNTGGQTIYLSGNFVVSSEEDDEDEDEDDDDLMDLAKLGYSDASDSEEDHLDDLSDPRIVEIEKDEEKSPEVIKPSKSKNKRLAEDDAVPEADYHEKKPVVKGGKPQAKKLKTTADQDVAAPDTTSEAKAEIAKKPKKEKEGKAKKEETAPQPPGKKVQFAEKLKQGPTPSKDAPKGKDVRVVNDVIIDDKVDGTGRAAKNGDRVEMRYIGKLEDGSHFDGQSATPFIPSPQLT